LISTAYPTDFFSSKTSSCERPLAACACFTGTYLGATRGGWWWEGGGGGASASRSDDRRSSPPPPELPWPGGYARRLRKISPAQRNNRAPATQAIVGMPYYYKQLAMSRRLDLVGSLTVRINPNTTQARPYALPRGDWKRNNPSSNSVTCCCASRASVWPRSPPASGITTTTSEAGNCTQSGPGFVVFHLILTTREVPQILFNDRSQALGGTAGIYSLGLRTVAFGMKSAFPCVKRSRLASASQRTG